MMSEINLRFHFLAILGCLAAIGFWLDVKFDRIERRLDQLEKIIERMEIRLDRLYEFKNNGLE